MKKILVVDDEQDIVELVKNRLEANHYTVISASDGNQGIKMVEQQKPDLIIMDIMMPNMPGGEAVRLLRASSITKHIPIVFLTGIVSDMPKGAEEKKVNVDGEFYTAIAKPFKAEKLLLEIRKLIGND
jgi:CheY-like chemotaxis protein